jgi:small subunit ribosomal protein S3
MVSERKFIKENVRRVLLKEYLRAQTARAGFGGIDIQRTPLGTHITLIAERPGLVIGRRGATINELTRAVEEDYKFEHPQIEVSEVANPALNPHIMAQKLALALERGWHFRRAGHSTVLRIMEAGAKGCQVTISGKLTGERHRTVRFKAGHVKYCGEPKLQFMWTAYATAMKKAGMMGIKVQIMDPNARLPDEIEVMKPAEALAKGLIPKVLTEAEAAALAALPPASGEVSDEELQRVLEGATERAAPKRRPRAKKAQPPAAEGDKPTEAKPRRTRAKKAQAPAAAEGEKKAEEPPAGAPPAAPPPAGVPAAEAPPAQPAKED